MEELTKEEEQKLLNILEKEVYDKPPTIGLIGVSGVGKSSTINTLFKTNLAISHTKACTKEFEEIELGIKAKHGVLEGKNVQLVIYDAPGLGEDIDKDPQYIEMYKENLPKCDVIIWILSARNRAIALDQQYLEIFREYKDRIIFGLNQVDLIEPMDWNPNFPIPSKIQRERLNEIIQDRRDKLSKVMGKEVNIIPYSNYKHYNLEPFFTGILESCQTKRKWLLHALKSFQLEDFEISNYSIINSEDSSDIKEKNSCVNKSKKRGILDHLKLIVKGPQLSDVAKEKIKEITKKESIDKGSLSKEDLSKIENYLSNNKN